MKLYYFNQLKSKLTYNKPDGTKKTIASSGCGVVSACIVMNTLAQKDLVTIKKIRDLAINSGARTNDGTNEYALLNAIVHNYDGFSFKTSRSVDDLIKHLKKGGMAICNQGKAYDVFSNAGHYVVAYKMVGDNIQVVDPSWTATKYDKGKRPERIVKKSEYGCIVKPSIMALATQDRSPCYYLVSYSKPKTFFTPDATVKKECDVYCDNKLKVPTGHLLKGEKVKVRFKGKVLSFIQYNTYDGYAVGLVKLSNLKFDK